MKLTSTLLAALFLLLLFSGGFLLGCDEGGVPVDMDNEMQEGEPVFEDEEDDEEDEWEDFDMDEDFGEELPQ